MSTGKHMTHSRRLPADGPSLTRVCGAGFLLLPARAGLRPLPGRAGSYMISAGVGPSSGAGSRPSGGTWIFARLQAESEQVSRGVLVPVHDQAARLASEPPLGRFQAWLSPSTCRAGLGARIPTVGYQERSAVPGGLIGEHAPGLAEALVGDRTGRPVVCEHSGHVQVFGNDRLVAGGEATGGLA